MSATRMQVFEIVSDEVDYQEEKYPETDLEVTVEAIADRLETMTDDPTHDDNLRSLQEIAALAVFSLQKYGTAGDMIHG